MKSLTNLPSNFPTIIQTLLLTVILFGSCDVLKNGEIPISKDFVRIYNVDSDKSFVALSMGELSNQQGYLLYGYQLIDNIAAGSQQAPYILHVDIEGGVVWDTLLSDWDHSDVFSQKWMQIDDNYYFSYYDSKTKDYLIAEFNFEKSQVNTIFSYTEQFPSALNLPASFISLSLTPDNMLLYGYYDCNAGNGLPRYLLHSIEPSTGNIIWTGEFPNLAGKLAAEFDDICSDREADMYPVQLGFYQDASGNDIVYAKLTEKSEVQTTITDSDFSYSLHRYDANTGEFIDRIPYMGVHYMPDGSELNSMPIAISVENATKSIDSLKIATINFTSEESDVMIPQVTINLNADTLIGRDNGFSTHEYDHENPIYIHYIDGPDGKNYLMYVGTTWSGQMLISVFDPTPADNGPPVILNKKYFGYKLYYEARDFITTSDGGFAVFGYTLIAGRFQQFCLFKFSSEQFSDLIYGL